MHSLGMSGPVAEQTRPAGLFHRMSDLHALIERLRAEQHRLISDFEVRGASPDGSDLDRIASLERRILAVEALIEDR